MEPTTAVLLMAYGGPDSLADVEPYLLDVRGGRQTPSELVEEIRERYAAIGGKSPLLEITRRQAAALEHALDCDAPGQYRVFVGMRHWKPYIREAVDQIAQAEITRVVALCMTPFYSRMSTGAYYDHLHKAVESHAPESAWRKALSLRKIGAWYDHPGFVSALAANLNESLAEMESSGREAPVVLFTAHSLPSALAEQGDPYASQFAQLCSLVAATAELRNGQWHTCYQSAGAQSTRWLGPSLEETIETVATDGKRSVLVSPIGFLSDHVEVLYDIDVEAQHTAEQVGISLSRTASLNDRPLFIEALADIVHSDEWDL